MSQSGGPRYWESKFGLDNLEDFQREAEKYLPDVPIPSWLGGGNSDDPATAAAYLAPILPLGIYLASRFQAAGLGLSTVQSTSMANNLPSSDPENPVNTMTTLIIPNAFQVSIEAVSGGQDIVNVIGVTNAAGTAAGAAAAVKAAWEASGGPLSQLSSLVAVQNYHAVDLSSSHGTIADLASTAVGGKTTTNSLATVGACALVQWNGSIRSRRTRGRLYYGPIMEANINPDGRTLVTTSVTQIGGAFTQFLTGIATAGYPLAVLSRLDLAAYPVTSSAVESVIATQRRRIRT